MASLLDPHRDEVIALYTVSRLGCGQIGKRFGCSGPTVHAFLVGQGVETRPRPAPRIKPKPRPIRGLPDVGDDFPDTPDNKHLRAIWNAHGGGFPVGGRA